MLNLGVLWKGMVRWKGQTGGVKRKMAANRVGFEQFEQRVLLTARMARSTVEQPSAKQVLDYSGHWETSEGPMDITQNGKDITAVITPPSVGPVEGRAVMRGNGVIKGKVIFDLAGTKTIVKYEAKLLANDPNKMEGKYNLKFVGITQYTADFTAMRDPI